jgi:2-oxoglutarate dehydrogenase E2 component (dihydrolipoamide succinyltransferase)
MAIEVKAPSLGESVSEIYVGRWYKSPGDSVAKDEPLVELESDKATIDLPAAESGKLIEVFKPSGSTVEIGEVLALLEPGAVADLSKPSRQNRGPAEPAKPNVKASETQAADHENGEEGDRKGAFSYNDIAGPVADVAEPKAETEARESREARPTEQKLAHSMPTRSKPPELAMSRGDVSSADAGRQIERVPMSPLRRRISLRLVEAQQQSALLTTFNEADMSVVKQLRADFGEAFEKKHGKRLGFMGFFVKAAVAALEQFPQINAMIEGNDIVYRRFCDIGIAVSTDKGLVVPVLRDADRMSIAQVEHSIDNYAKLARDGDLKVDDLRGGTFTITNGGIFGSLLSTPIINPPQSGVLGMHAIQDRPVARKGEVVIRPMMYLALTYDHRIVDGREAVMFLAQIRQSIENPSRLLLDI